MKVRLVLVLVGLTVWVGAVTWRLYELQFFRHEAYAQKAENQQHRKVTLEPP